MGVEWRVYANGGQSQELSMRGLGGGEERGAKSEGLKVWAWTKLIFCVAARRRKQRWKWYRVTQPPSTQGVFNLRTLPGTPRP